MELTFYVEEYIQLAQLPFPEMLYRLVFWYFGWLPIAVAFLYGAAQIWLYYIEGKWAAKQEFILLAIDLPKNNEASPKAVENLFAYLMGAQSNPNLMETWWEGKFQLGFSLEIIGIEGYIQFLIRAPAAFRSLVETAVYSQYPDAEITPVADYIEGALDAYPDAEFDMWGSEYMLTGPEFLPIKSYKDFEHQFGRPETQFKDPLAELMDLLSSLNAGEQLWLQLIISPIDNAWTKAADEYIAGVIGDPEKILYLTPHKRKMLEMALEKRNQLNFKSKIRAVYLARKDAMDKAKVVNGLMGYFRQFGINNLNGLKPNTRNFTSTAYFMAAQRVNARKRQMISAYKYRSLSCGANAFLLSLEELATLWHFPVDAVIKAPLLQRASARKIEAPMSLPEGVTYRETEPIFESGYEITEPPAAVEPTGVDFGAFLEQNLNQEEKTQNKAPDNLPLGD